MKRSPIQTFRGLAIAVAALGLSAACGSGSGNSADGGFGGSGTGGGTTQGCLERCFAAGGDSTACNLACSTSAGGTGGGVGTGGAGVGGAGTGGVVGTGGAATGGAGGGPQTPQFACHNDPPPGAPLPPPARGYSGGACPAIMPGRNTIMSGGAAREFVLVLPTDYDGSSPLPGTFIWHWLAGNANDLASPMQEAANNWNFIGIVPEKKGDVQFTWPATALDSEPRFQEELTFFDDMYACVTAQYNLRLGCVGTIGVSAGALWTAQLGWARSEYLSSMIVLSGGTGGGARLWGGAQHRLPAMVLWGGPTDNFIINFEALSLDLEQNLAANGHFVVECIHNCGHGVPPPEPGQGTNAIEGAIDAIVSFALEHPYWLSPGESPWNATGLPTGTPSFCAIGVGNAVPRTGDCTGGFGI